MSFESRVQFLRRAAERADREGNSHLAALLRKMADELRPAGETLAGPPFSPSHP
jgi:hypothetical protein